MYLITKEQKKSLHKSHSWLITTAQELKRNKGTNHIEFAAGEAYREMMNTAADIGSVIENTSTIEGQQREQIMRALVMFDNLPKGTSRGYSQDALNEIRDLTIAIKESERILSHLKYLDNSAKGRRMEGLEDESWAGHVRLFDSTIMALDSNEETLKKNKIKSFGNLEGSNYLSNDY